MHPLSGRQDAQALPCQLTCQPGQWSALRMCCIPWDAVALGEATREGRCWGRGVFVTPFSSPPEFGSTEGEPRRQAGRDGNITVFLISGSECGSGSGGQGS